jgi:hypothetical protein
MQAPTSLVPGHLRGVRTAGNLPFVSQSASGTQPADFVARGPLAARAHRLLGLGAAGSARLGQAQGSLAAAFGGDVAAWQRTGAPWIAARSLARPPETLASHSSVGWLLANSQGPPRADPAPDVHQLQTICSS